ncbi:nucleotide disphospho-sugar-binding domain-containing protein [Streptomyces chartreusis]|uniref:nucleotide disphospho-sugar-binding domain-containing protein n=1 Tax=Streptomyces chartreusis TaxID=1969 RepID=UPI0033DA7D55
MALALRRQLTRTGEVTAMRYLFTTIPGASHMLPLVPLAHAALAAGHDVLVAANGSARTTAATAGLHTVATDDGRSVRPYDDLVRRFTETDVSWNLTPGEVIEHVAGVFAEVAGGMADGLVDIARTWKADAVVYCPPAVAGLLAARAAGIPAVLHGIGTRRPTFRPALNRLAPVAERLGAPAPAEAEVEIDLSPPSLETIHQDSPHQGGARHTLPMRYAPYTGGAELPDWALRRGEKPRIAVTLGSLRVFYSDGAHLRDILKGTEELDVEVVLTTSGAELTALPSPLPGHVRTVDWMPLRALLATCDAIVHHGGMGTMYAAFDAGVPQLGVPMAHDDGWANAQVLVARGAGLMLEGRKATGGDIAAALRDLLGEPGYRGASQEVAAEMRAMPTPADVVRELPGLLGAAS